MKIIVVIVLISITGLTYFVLRIKSTQSKISKGQIIDISQRKNKALLIIDLQKDLTTSRGKLAMDTVQTDVIIEALNELLITWEKTEYPVIYIQQEYQEEWLLNLLTANALTRSSEGVELDEQLLQLKDKNKTYYLTKHIRDAFSNPELDEILKKHQVGELYITGIDAAYCVSASIDAAIHRGYEITVVETLVGTKKKQDLSHFIKSWKDKGVAVRSTLPKWLLLQRIN
jgi:nicotinamidase-related amidase